MIEDGGSGASSMERARQRRGVQAAVAAYLLWGFLTIYWKELHRFDPFELIGWRIISAFTSRRVSSEK